ncbi:WD repeat-containing protein 26-like isoform X2 [Convolutriloba macropyga]|uniref:WD repeat-containing protein 26-like isoform X2 n=1 Tax=Convolutriloba macropyga TaxID=536237 RepID=UPI003F522D0D
MVENTSRSEFMPGNAMNLKMLATECENGFGDENSTDDVIGTVNPITNGHSRSTRPKVYTERDKEMLRVIGQFFTEIGLTETANCLTRESQCTLEHPSATNLRRHVLNGNWKLAESCLEELRNVISHHTHQHKMRYLLYEQKFLELLDEGRVIDAVKCLRGDISRIPVRSSCSHHLASLAMFATPEDVRKSAHWPGKGKQSRTQLVDRLGEFLPPDVMLPRERLRKLVEQSLQYQISNCTYHAMSNSTSCGTTSNLFSPLAAGDQHHNNLNSHQHHTSCSSTSTNTAIDSGDGGGVVGASTSSQTRISECSTSSSHSNSYQSSLSLLTDHKCSKNQFPCRMRQTIMDSEEYLYCKFNHKGNSLAAAGNSGHIQLFTVTAQHRLKAFDKKLDHEAPVGFFSWSPDDRYLLSCGARSSSKATVWSMATMDRVVRVSNGPEDCLTTCCWLPDSTHFAVAGIQGHFYLCDLSGNIESSWEGIRVIALAAHSKENTVLAADNHNRVRSYTVDRDSTIIQTDKAIMSLEVSRCDQFLLCTMEKGAGLQMFHLESGTLLMRFAGVKQERDFIYSSFGVEETFVASGSEDKCVYIWHRNRQLPIAVLSGHTKQVNGVDWNPSIPSMLVSISDDCTIKVWGPSPPSDPLSYSATDSDPDSDFFHGANRGGGSGHLGGGSSDTNPGDTSGRGASNSRGNSGSGDRNMFYSGGSSRGRFDPIDSHEIEEEEDDDDDGMSIEGEESLPVHTTSIASRYRTSALPSDDSSNVDDVASNVSGILRNAGIDISQQPGASLGLLETLSAIPEFRISNLAASQSEQLQRLASAASSSDQQRSSTSYQPAYSSFGWL